MSTVPLTYQVDSYYSVTARSSRQFASLEEAQEYAAEQSKAVPRWYNRILIREIKEEIIQTITEPVEKAP